MHVWVILKGDLYRILNLLNKFIIHIEDLEGLGLEKEHKKRP